MTWGGRALAGAAFGALVTLLAHPASRPFFSAFANRTDSARLSQCLDRTTSDPAPPADLLGASLWVELGLDRLSRREAPLRPKEVATILRITGRAIDKDNDNAYWRQARSVLLMAAGRPQEAKAEWIRASRATIWNDFQKERLFRARDHLASLVGAEQSWQLAYVFQMRTSVAGNAIERFARTLLAGADTKSEDGLTVRFATLANGTLMRNGARSLATGNHGANIVELTAYPSEMALSPSPRRLWTGQTEMLNHMEALAKRTPDWADKSDRAREMFASNEGWRALIAYEDRQDATNWLAAASVATSGLTGALAAVALLGALLWAIGIALGRWFGTAPRVHPLLVAGVALLLGGLAVAFTHDYWAGIAPALCAACLVVSPKTARRARPDDIGPLFAALIYTLGTLFGFSIVTYLLGKTPAAVGVLPQLAIPADYYRTPIMLGMGAIFAGMLLLAVPMWSVAQRLGTPHVLGLALRKFGAAIGFGGLALSIVLTPVVVYADREIAQKFYELVGNEPVYYYLHQ